MSVVLRFHGAAGGVTGSSFLIESGSARVLIDCGMFQGSKSERTLNERAFPYDPHELDAVLLTHAHIDHSGLLPKLHKDGYTGPIFATAATIDLCSVMLPDSAYIQEVEAKRRGRLQRRRARAAADPLYTAADVVSCMTQFRPVDFKSWTSVAPGIRARYWNAGHLLGSASIELEVEPGRGGPLRILFSGDIGPNAKLLQRDPESPSGVDYLVCEATYGDVDRIDATIETRRAQLRTQVEDAVRRGGALLIPSFAVERTQEILVDLIALFESGEVRPFPIIIDSPLATRASQVFRQHAVGMESGDDLLRALASPHVRFTESVEDSKALDELTEFHAVISASGMCEAGRIRHRLKNWLWRPEATVLIVGYQAAGTLGRVLLDGAPVVRIMGEAISVKAVIRSIDLYSGHADAPELAHWIAARQPVKHELFLVHGEADARAGLMARISAAGAGSGIVLPELDDAFELTDNGAVAVSGSRRTVAPRRIGVPDANNELASLLLDIGDAMEVAPDENSKAVIVRRLRRALEAR